MLKKFIAISALGLTASFSLHADPDFSCAIQVAVSTPPVLESQNVAFNVNSEYGFSKAITLSGGMSPQVIENIPCSSGNIVISATMYDQAGTRQAKHQGPVVIGQCVLKAGPITLNGPQNSVSVVFPYDFNCKS